MKRPSFQFYPGDWLRATEVRSCSVGARGLWIDMICLMHEGNPYGHLKVGEKVILPSNLARMVGATIEEVEGWLAELEEANVFSRDDAGCIFSRRMIRDEETRAARAAGGHLGGNPALKAQAAKDNLPANLKPTPASASSSAPAGDSTTNVVVDTSGVRFLPPCPFDELVELYHATLPTCTRVAKLTEKRKGHIRARWRDVWAEKGKRGKPRAAADLLAFFADYFATAAESPFLTGKVDGTNGRAPFVADIDYLFREPVFIKVVEGGYPPGKRSA